MKPGFQDFDPARTCHITAQQFGRVLKGLQLMPTDDVFELLCKNYFDKNNTREVNYVKFCQDVDRPEDMFPSLNFGEPDNAPAVFAGTVAQNKSNFFPGSTKGLSVLQNRFQQPSVNISNDPNDIEKRIQSLVVMKRVRINEFFRDFDKLRKGKVTPTQFKAILSSLNFNLTEEEFESIINKYKTPDNMVNYAEFVEIIDQAFTLKGIDKHPNVRVAPISSDATLHARKKFLEFDESDSAEMLAILEEYRRIIQTKRLEVKPMFQDFDITKCGHVTKTQFIRVLNQLNIMIDERFMSQLLKKYMDKGNADEVNYFEFCNDVDRPEDMFGAGRDFNHSFDYFSAMKPHPVGTEIVREQFTDIDDLLSRMRQACKEKRVRVSEFFRDFDRLRSGDVTIAQTRIALNMAKLNFSQKEFENICQSFPGKKSGHLNWKALDDAIESAFQVKGLEKLTNGEETRLGRTTVNFKQTSGKSDASLAHNLVDRFRQKIIRERLDAKSFFQSWDRQNH